MTNGGALSCWNIPSLQCIAFKDINPQAPTHFLVVPIEPIPMLENAEDSQEQVLELSPSCCM